MNDQSVPVAPALCSVSAFGSHISDRYRVPRQACADVQSGVRSREGGQADCSAMRADENAVRVELVQVSSDRAGGDVEALREPSNRHLPHLGDVGR